MEEKAAAEEVKVEVKEKQSFEDRQLKSLLDASMSQGVQSRRSNFEVSHFGAYLDEEEEESKAPNSGISL